MWDFGNRGAVLLISVTCGCILIYNAWGAILVLALTLLLVSYACYSLLVNDSLLSPHAYYVLGYLPDALFELRAALDITVTYGTEYVSKIWHSVIHCCREYSPFRMDKRRNYQLSSDSYAASGVKPRQDSSSSSLPRFGVIDQFSPIPRAAYGLRANDTLVLEDKFYHAGDHDRSQLIFGKHTSTPVNRFDRRQSKNGDAGLPSSSQISSRRSAVMHNQNHILSRNENLTQFSPEGSPWGTSISPKMRARAAGVKTVQTVAGPLLASTRLNIDPKVYTDVSSPGLTTRLTKYATEANNKLTHQSQYGTGQFPRVNINASPIPLLNARATKMRMPVTVRVAAPDVIRYSSPERKKMLSNICHMENKSPTSVVQVLRDISLKRHASGDDVTFDVAKKQKIDSLFNEEQEVPQESRQKRCRDDSCTSEDDFSPRNVSIRPAKRTKTPSCYDILNSLSSSIHVTPGIKRKAIDLSRSETPNLGKHFKSLDCTQSSDPHILPQSQNLDISHNKPGSKEIYSKNCETINNDKLQEHTSIKGILRSPNNDLMVDLDAATSEIHKTVEFGKTVISRSVASNESTKLTDKLFMRAEPKQSERLKLLVEEQGIKTNFTMNNVEEIKTEDIRNMRRTNMKARLQSMFDAISGKGDNEIKPDVVIQADEIKTTKTVTSLADCATLNSLTTTTNVNTTPISTSAIVPGGLSTLNPDTKLDHVAFNLSNTVSPNVLATNTFEIKTGVSSAKMDELIDKTKVTSATSAVVNTDSLQSTMSSISNTIPTFTFGKPVSEVSTTTSRLLPSFGANTSNSHTITSISLPASSTSNFLEVDKTSLSSAFVPINSTNTNAKVESNNITITNANINSSTAANTPTSSIFTFSNNKSSSSTMPAVAQTLSLTSPSQFAEKTLSSNTNISSAAVSNSVERNTSTSIMITSAPVQTPLFTFGNSNNFTSPPPKSDIFAFGQSKNNVQSTNTFQISSNSQAISLPQDTKKSFTFASLSSGSTSGANKTSFNTNVTNTTESLITSTFPSTVSTSTNKPLFVFGANTGNTMATTTGNTTSFATMNTNTIPTIFGASTAGTSQFGTLTTSVPQFEASTTTTSQLGVSTTTTSQFGTAMTSPLQMKVPMTTIPQFGTSAITAPQFGAVTTTVPQFVVSTTDIPQFVTSPTTISQFMAPTTTIIQSAVPTVTVAQFGATTTSVCVPTQASNINVFGTINNQSIFGSTLPATTNIFNIPKTTTAPSFDLTTNVTSSSSTTNSNLLPGSNIKTNAALSTTTISSVFGINKPVIEQAKSFGMGTCIFGNTTTPSFGSQTTATPTVTPTFGITSASTSTIIPNFGSANNVTSAFGTPNVTTTTNTQNTTIPAFGDTSSMFGLTNNTSIPTFGANVTSTVETFPSSTNTFGGQNTTNFAFGATANSSTFGDNKPVFGTTPAITTGFGTSNSAVPVFSNNNNNNAIKNTNNMFFGNNQKTEQQDATFSFGSNFNAGNNNSTNVPSVPFQFGSTSSKPATGFNFTAPSTTPTINFGTSGVPTFNASAPGTFNIGSGSTASRSRITRTRKPR